MYGIYLNGKIEQYGGGETTSPKKGGGPATVQYDVGRRIGPPLKSPDPLENWRKGFSKLARFKAFLDAFLFYVKAFIIIIII